MVLLSGVRFRVGAMGVPLKLQALLSCAAWWSWYALGVEQRRWNTAWVVSLLLVFLGMLNVGLEAVLWFYLPLVFLPRQLNAKMRMQMPSRGTLQLHRGSFSSIPNLSPSDLRRSRSRAFQSGTSAISG